ncbi:MAG: helix-turn-helix transcriptional regulator [Actinobacteria bacterium]|nr:helix-turn-helix transcriptional regulator [Actinomycetota bacterium]
MRLGAPGALLALGEATATTLAGKLPVTRQAIAKHLTVLERVGLVDGRKEGRQALYAIRPERLDEAAHREAQAKT